MTFLTRLKNMARRLDRRLRSPQRSQFELADVTEPEWKIIRAVGDRTMTTPERLISFRGGSVMAASLRLMDLGSTDRDPYLYDTFEGMPTPGAEDIDVHGQSAAEPFSQLQLSETSSNWARAALDEVRENVFGTGYPRDRFHSSRGWSRRRCRESCPNGSPSFGSTRTGTSPRGTSSSTCSPAGPRWVLLVDDYGHFRGAAKAVDEYIATLPYPMFLARVDYTARIATKPPLTPAS